MSSSDSAAQLLLVEALGSVKVIQYVTVSMLALLCFDICIFFADEYRFVWKASWSWGKILYLFIRYGTLLETVSALHLSLYINPSSTSCQAFLRIHIEWASTLTLAIQVVQLLRAAAVYSDSSRKKKIIRITSVLLFAAILTLDVLLLLSYKFVQYPMEGLSCALSATMSKPIYLSSYACALTSDIAISGTCAIKVFRLWSGGESRLAWIMFRDILAYILVLSAMAIPQFITPLLLPATSSIIVAALSYAIMTLSGIASCRMILNMRKCARGLPDVSLASMAIAYPTAATLPSVAFERGEVESESLADSWDLYKRADYETA